MSTLQDIDINLLAKAIARQDEDAVRHIVLSLKRWNVWWFDMINPKTKDTALHLALRSECLPIIKFLCESCHIQEDGKRKTCKTCSTILELSNKEGKKALHEAAILSNARIIQYLLDLGANVDSLKAGDWTPLMLVCVKSGFVGATTAHLLLDAGANPSLTNKDGWTPLHLACRVGNVETVQTLLTFFPHERASNNGRTPLHIACLHGHKLVVEELCRFSCSLDPVDACGLTPLHEAIRGGHIAVFRYLISRGADIGKTDGMEMTCLHIAATSGRVRLLEILLLEFGFPVDETTRTVQLTPLHCAVRGGQMDSVKTLLINGANPRMVDARGRQGVDFCNGCDSEEMMSLLTTPVNC